MRYFAANYIRDLHGPIEDTDEYADGCIGLMQAIERYRRDFISPKTGRPVKFSTYASWWITQAIQRGFDERYGARNCGKQHARETLFSMLDVRNGSEELQFASIVPAPEDLELEEIETPLQRIWPLLDILDSRDRRVIFKRLMGMTFQEVGNEENPPVCRERVRQIEERALRVLRKEAERIGLDQRTRKVSDTRRRVSFGRRQGSGSR